MEKTTKKKKTRKKRKPNIKTWLVPKLRRLSYQWPNRKDAKVAARVSRGKYKCAACEDIFGPKEISLDHTVPVIDPIDGYQDWNTYISRLFCEEADGFQVLCNPCHDMKTEWENTVRAENNEEFKKLWERRRKSLTNEEK